MAPNNVYALLLLIGATIAAYWYWPSAATEASIRNETKATVAVRLESDSGTLYPVNTIAAGGKATVELSGKDQRLWAIALYADGQSRESRKISGGSKEKWLIVIRNDAIDIAHP